MRTRYLLAALLSVVLAACASGATPSPTTEPSAQPPQTPAPTTEPSAQPPEAPAPTATTSVLDVKVTFDGETCTYLGPSVILDGTVMQLEYAPTEREFWGSYLMIYGVKPGTTWEMWLAAIEENPNVRDGDVPDWVYEESAAWTQGPSTMLYKIEAVKTSELDPTEYPVGAYHIVCNTTTAHPSAQLSVAGP